MLDRRTRGSITRTKVNQLFETILPGLSSMNNRPYANAAEIYRQAGWLAPIPVDVSQPGVTAPGAHGRMNLDAWPPADEIIRQWIRDYGDKNIGLWLADDVIGIDVDVYDGKHGDETILWLETNIAHEPLPPTYTSTCRGAHQPSRIHFYRVPSGITWQSNLVVKGDGAGQKTLGNVDIIQAGHRYARVWPSIKRGNSAHVVGNVYHWYSPDGSVMHDVPRLSDLPVLPESWVNVIRDSRRLRGYSYVGNGTYHSMTEHEIQAWADTLPVEDEFGLCLQMKQTLQYWTERLQSNVNRHDSMKDGIWAIIGDGIAGHRGALSALDELRDVFFTVATDRDNIARLNEWNRALDHVVPKRGNEVIKSPCTCNSGLRWLTRAMRTPNAGTSAEVGIAGSQSVAQQETSLTAGTLPPVGDIDYERWYGTHTDDVVERVLDVFGEHFRAIHQRSGAPVWFRNIGEIWVEDKKHGIHNAIKYVGQLMQTELRIWRERCERLAGEGVNDWRTRLVGGNGRDAHEFRIIASLQKLVDGIQNNEKKDQVEKAFSKHPRIAITEEELDANPRWLNLRNGHVIDVQAVHGGRPCNEWVIPRRADMMLTKQLGCAYVAEDDNVPTTLYELSAFKRYLEGVLPDADVRNTLQEIVGYALLGNPTEKIITLLHGMSDSGKTVLLEVLEAMFGTYAVWADASALIAGKARSAHQGWLHNLKGARLILTPETAKDAKLDAAWMKSYTGREIQTSRPPYGDRSVSWAPVGIIFNASNHYLKYDAMDTAVSERTQVFEFEKRFLRGSSDRDETLPDAIKRYELHIVLNWALEGLRRRGAQGRVHIAPLVEKWSEVYRFAQSDTQQFINDCLSEGWLHSADSSVPTSRMVKIGVVYALYESWCKDQKIRDVLGQHDFNAELMNVHGWTKKNSGGWRWVGYTSPFESKLSVMSREFSAA